MATFTVLRNYRMLDAELCMFTSNLCNFLTRDLDDLSILGLTEDMIDDLKSLGDTFEVFPPDETFVGDLMIATETKNSLRFQLQEIIRTMALRVETKWGVNSGKYKRLNIGPIVRLIDDVFLTSSRDMQIKMTEYLPDLTNLGLNQDMLDDWENLNDQFELARNAQADAVALRDEKTQERINLGNQVYELVTTYCNFGKRIYEKTNPAKYNDYLIYGAGTGSSDNGGTNPNAPAAPSNFRYDYAEVAIRWSAVSGATSYQVEFSEDNVNWEVIYEGPDTEFITNPMLAEHTFLRARARNANGFSAFTSVVNIVYDLTLPMAQNLTYLPAYPGFNWDVVPGAINYEVHLRNQSAPPDEWLRIYFGNDNTLYHADPIGSYAYRIRAWNNQGTSAWAELEYSVTP